MQKLTKQEILKQFQDLMEFKYEFDEFHRNNKLRDYLNKLFGSQFKAVFSTSKDYDYKHGLDWSGDNIICINHKDKMVEMGNSEWAFFR